MRLQNLHKINTVNRSVKILNKLVNPHTPLTQTYITLLSGVQYLGGETPTHKIHKLFNFWGYSFWPSDVTKYLTVLQGNGYIERVTKYHKTFKTVYFLWTITPEGLEILNLFEHQVRRTRHDR